MSESKKHIAQSGKNAGRFVSCNASGTCPIGGVHVTTSDLKAIKAHSGKKSVKDLTINDQISYKKAQVSNMLKPQFIGDRKSMTRDERDQAYGIEHDLDGKTATTAPVSFTKAQWMNFISKSYMSGVDIPLDVIKAGGANFREGNSRYTVKDMPLRGKQEDIDKLLAEFQEPHNPKIDIHSPAITKLLTNAPVYEKTATVKARRVTSSQNVTTAFGDFVETKNTAKVGDWIVTNPDGEEYILTDENFRSKYESSSTAGTFKAIGKIKAIKNPYKKDIEIVAPWGSPQFGDANSWLAVSLDSSGKPVDSDRYIIENGAFDHTYSRVN